MVRRGRAFWEKLVAEVGRRGVSYEEFARSHGVNVSTLRWWSSALRRENGGTRARAAVRMLPVEIAPGPGAAAPVEIRTTGGEVNMAYLGGGVLTYATKRPAPDGIDQNCDGVDGVDGDDDGHASLLTGGDDCDDADGGVYPGAVDPVDGLDQDCDGVDG